MKISEISQVWNNLFYPVLSTVVILFSLYCIVGKPFFKKALTSFSIKTDELVFGSNKQVAESENHLRTYDAIVKNLKEIIKKPITWLFASLILCFAVYRIMVFYSNNFFPLTYHFSMEDMAVYNVDKHTLAVIWAHFPDDSFSTLCTRISQIGSESSYSQGFDINSIYNILLWVKFVNILAFVVSIISLVKQKWKIALRGFITILITAALFLGLQYFEFTKQEKNISTRSVLYANSCLVERKNRLGSRIRSRRKN